MGLIFFATFNNLLGGVFMSLTDPYGLSLVSVEAWGFIWGFLSLGFIVGGVVVAKKGLGASPLRTLFLANLVMWTIAILFPVRSSIVPLVMGFFVYMCLIPAVQAAEQTIIQSVVPFEVQGRVFGFAQTVERAAAPITAFLIGPIAELWVIPFMTTGSGTRLIGPWFGTGADRGMALMFMMAGLAGLVVTVLAMKSRSYRILSQRYAQAPGGGPSEPGPDAVVT
jgi:DHA3 family multidrug efflux protein-like MFS transporter